MQVKTVFITGCSSGIGAALAREFHQRGHRVYATARQLPALDSLASAGVRALAVDVNDDAAIRAAFDSVRGESGSIDLLVNNAGFSRVGAVVDLTREDLRDQYETNVIAPVRVTALALPLLRAAVAARGKATVANVGSIVGLFTTPFAGAYCSSKAAMHSLTDALRMELAPFGIDVVSIQPGGVRSSFGEHAERRSGCRRIRCIGLPRRASAPARKPASRTGCRRRIRRAAWSMRCCVTGHPGRAGRHAQRAPASAQEAAACGRVRRQAGEVFRARSPAACRVRAERWVARRPDPARPRGAPGRRRTA